MRPRAVTVVVGVSSAFVLRGRGQRCSSSKTSAVTEGGRAAHGGEMAPAGNPRSRLSPLLCRRAKGGRRMGKEKEQG